MADNLLMGPHSMALLWQIIGVKSSPLIFGKGLQLYAQNTVTRNLLMLQMLLWCKSDIKSKVSYQCLTYQKSVTFSEKYDSS